MANPRDPVPVKWGIPVNPFTGNPITEHQQLMLNRLADATKDMAEVLHQIEGTQADAERYSTRRCSIAGTHLEELQLMAMRELLDK